MTDFLPNAAPPPVQAPQIPEKSTGRTLALAGLALLIVLTLGVSVFGLIRTASRDAALPDDNDAPASPEQKQALLREVEGLKKFVEEKRGLQFKSEVTSTVLPEDEFKERLRAQQRDELAEQEDDDFEDVLRGLGLIDKEVNITEETDELTGDAVLGFYDAETDELVIRGEDSTPFLRGVLVHELTHALQDQHFNLDRPEYEERNDEVILGLMSLAEGDALRIEQMYFDQLQSEARRQYQLEKEKAEARVAGGDFPEVLLLLISFPYQFGPDLVDSLLTEGGQPMLDQSFLDPPTTSEQILHVERYLQKQPRLEVPAPNAGGEVFDEGVFGEFALLLLLAETMPGQEAFEAAEGWGGDYYVAWREGERTCVRFDIAMDTAKDRSELIAGLRQWGEKHGGARIESGSRVRATACG